MVPCLAVSHIQDSHSLSTAESLGIFRWPSVEPFVMQHDHHAPSWATDQALAICQEVIGSTQDILIMIRTRPSKEEQSCWAAKLLHSSMQSFDIFWRQEDTIHLSVHCLSFLSSAKVFPFQSLVRHPPPHQTHGSPAIFKPCQSATEPSLLPQSHVSNFIPFLPFLQSQKTASPSM